jgi:hypothetical protein
MADVISGIVTEFLYQILFDVSNTLGNAVKRIAGANILLYKEIL